MKYEVKYRIDYVLIRYVHDGRYIFIFMYIYINFLGYVWNMRVRKRKTSKGIINNNKKIQIKQKHKSFSNTF